MQFRSNSKLPNNDDDATETAQLFNILNSVFEACGDYYCLVNTINAGAATGFSFGNGDILESNNNDDDDNNNNVDDNNNNGNTTTNTAEHNNNDHYINNPFFATANSNTNFPFNIPASRLTIHWELLDKSIDLSNWYAGNGNNDDNNHHNQTNNTKNNKKYYYTSDEKEKNGSLQYDLLLKNCDENILYDSNYKDMKRDQTDLSFFSETFCPFFLTTYTVLMGLSCLLYIVFWTFFTDHPAYMFYTKILLYNMYYYNPEYFDYIQDSPVLLFTVQLIRISLFFYQISIIIVCFNLMWFKMACYTNSFIFKEYNDSVHQIMNQRYKLESIIYSNDITDSSYPSIQKIPFGHNNTPPQQQYRNKYCIFNNVHMNIDKSNKCMLLKFDILPAFSNSPSDSFNNNNITIVNNNTNEYNVNINNNI